MKKGYKQPNTQFAELLVDDLIHDYLPTKLVDRQRMVKIVKRRLDMLGV